MAAMTTTATALMITATVFLAVAVAIALALVNDLHRALSLSLSLSSCSDDADGLDTGPHVYHGMSHEWQGTDANGLSEGFNVASCGSDSGTDGLAEYIDRASQTFDRCRIGDGEDSRSDRTGSSIAEGEKRDKEEKKLRTRHLHEWRRQEKLPSKRRRLPPSSASHRLHHLSQLPPPSPLHRRLLRSSSEDLIESDADARERTRARADDNDHDGGGGWPESAGKATGSDRLEAVAKVG